MAVLVQAYFVGMLANLLPLPGGIGGVDGGMIGALVAFGVGGGLALIAVLVYRLLAFWLPSIPGVIAYFQLRRTVGHWELRGEGRSEIGAAGDGPGRLSLGAAQRGSRSALTPRSSWIGVVPSPWASFTIVESLGSRLAFSSSEMWVRCSSAASASASWVIPRARRSVRRLSAKRSTISMEGASRASDR